MNDNLSPSISRGPYGCYDAAAREYVITRPDTPTPWINYLGEGRYGGIISNTAGGFSFDRDPRNRRVTRYRYNAVPADQPGRYFYLRDMQSGILEPDLAARACAAARGLPMPARRGIHPHPQKFQGITANLLYFVPPGTSPRPARSWGCG